MRSQGTKQNIHLILYKRPVRNIFRHGAIPSHLSKMSSGCWDFDNKEKVPVGWPCSREIILTHYTNTLSTMQKHVQLYTLQKQSL